MQPVFQKHWHAACVATLLGVPLEDVPHTVKEHGANWYGPLRKWLNGRGYDLLHYNLARRGTRWMPRGYWIASVHRPFERHRRHAIVMHGSEVVHDPNPDPALEGKYGFGNSAVILIVPFSPTKGAA